MYVFSSSRLRCVKLLVVVLLFGLAPAAAWAVDPDDIIITEIMSDSLSAEPRWEWAEIKNTTDASINLNNWVFGDRVSRYNFANILDGGGSFNTTVPAGGVAVLYNASSGGLGTDTARFTSAWGSGYQLIPVSTWPSLNNGSGGDRIGLWVDHDSYGTDGSMENDDVEPDWASAIFEVDYASAATIGGNPNPNRFPANTAGRSIAWTGSGNVRTGTNWVTSLDNDMNDYGARTSAETFQVSGSINNPNDAGTPGYVDASQGSAPAGKLVISEIMYNPASITGTNETHFEWVELVNNTGAAIDFSVTPYLFDDGGNPNQATFNVNSGIIPINGIAVLYSQSITTTLGVSEETLRNVWEIEGINEDYALIPVTNWPALANGGDTVALWDSESEHASDLALGGPETWLNTIAQVTYNDGGGSMSDWPDVNVSSIYLIDLSADPNVGSNWGDSATSEFGVINPDSIPSSTIVDHVGGDQGSPGFVPEASTILYGDYNGDEVVDAADYTVWRDNLGTSFDLMNEDPTQTPGEVTRHDYTVWKNNYGMTLMGSGGVAGRAGTVPEPSSVALVLLGALGLCSRRK